MPASSNSKLPSSPAQPKAHGYPTKLTKDRAYAESNNGLPAYDHDSLRPEHEKHDALSSLPAPGTDLRWLAPSGSQAGASLPSPPLSPANQAPGEDKEVGAMRSFFKRLGGDEKEADKHRQRHPGKSEETMIERWGPEGSPMREIVARYWKATHMKNHWETMRYDHPHRFKSQVQKGYCEPIPTLWVQNRILAEPYPETYPYETPAEERLYYYLNNGDPPDGFKQPHLRPLNIKRDRNAIIRRGNERNARAHALDPARLAAYRSPHDVFLGDQQIRSYEYSTQVDNIMYEARTRALHELANGIQHGTDHLETMLLLDISGSMLWNPHDGIPGPDGVMRYHDQPANIELVRHLVHRVLFHMADRARRQHPKQYGIDTVTFSTWGNHVGQLSPENFNKDWSRIRLGGGTQVMQGWQVVKNTYFQEQRKHGHGHWDPAFGWQPTPGMPKLSLLVFLDGEAMDMDEFELELLGETWAYVTIALVGMENCPHHHSHAVELERVSKFNPHIGFFDVHGRVCERMVVEELLRSVYPVDPPAYAEITKPEYDLVDELPSYKR
jgi:hypothetical protein